MATINAGFSRIAKGVMTGSWLALNAVSDVGSALDAPNYPDKVFSADGTFLAGVVSIEGSNNTSTGPWATLNDTRGVGNALTFSVAGVKQALENPRYVRPRMTTATAVQPTRSINIRVVAQSPRR